MLDRLITSRWVHIMLLLALLCAAVFLSFSHDRWRQQIRNFTFDNYNILYPRKPSDSAVIVDIDEASLKKTGQWPWPRDVIANLVTNLKNMGAAVIVFDVTFPEPDRSSPNNIAAQFAGKPGAEDIAARLKSMPDTDEALGAAIAQAGNVVTGFSFTGENQLGAPAQKGIFRGRDVEKFIIRAQGATSNLKTISVGAAGEGSFYVTTDTDGIIRRVPMLGAYASPGSDIVSVYPSLSLEAIRVLDNEKGGRVLLADSRYAALDPQRFGIAGIQIGQNGRTIPTDGRGNFLVYFAQSNPAWYLPAWQVLDKSLDPAKIKGKIVFIGTSAAGLEDIRSTPLNIFIPGVEVHLNIVDQILQGKYLTRSIEAEGMEAAAVFAVGLFLIICAPFIGALAQAMIVAALIAAGIFAGFHAFTAYGLLIDITYPAFSILAIFMLSTILTYMRAERERRAIRQAFGLYISPDFVAELTRHPDKLRLGGETRELTVMFTDIRNFTSISEGLKPQELIHLMNDFLTPMSDLVMRNRGAIDKYIGDAMMAFWNAPLDDFGHARHACLTALKIQSALEPVNAGLKARGASVLLKAGIGVNTGPCAVGNMGSRQRFAYSALGDAVNLASRLEGQTKTYGVPIIIGEATRAQAPEFAALELDLILVKGKAKPSRIFALLGDEETEKYPAFRSLKSAHGEMISAYQSGDFKKAANLVKDCAALKFSDLEKLYALYAERMEHLSNVPPKDWTGVYEAKGK